MSYINSRQNESEQRDKRKVINYSDFIDLRWNLRCSSTRTSRKTFIHSLAPKKILEEFGKSETKKKWKFEVSRWVKWMWILFVLRRLPRASWFFANLPRIKQIKKMEQENITHSKEIFKWSTRRYLVFREQHTPPSTHISQLGVAACC